MSYYSDEINRIQATIFPRKDVVARMLAAKKFIDSKILSILVAIILLVAIEGLGAILHPFPSDFGGSSDEVMQHVANSPFWVLILLGGVGWAVTILSATWLATRLGANRHPAHGVGIGLLLFGAALFNMAMLPYPVWFWILNLLLLPAGIYFGVSLGMVKSKEVI